MCYNAAYETDRSFRKAIHDEQDPEAKANLQRQYEIWKEKNPDIYREVRETRKDREAKQRYFTNGFEHEAFPVIILEDGQKVFGEFHWGLIPRWCREEEKAFKLWNQCINARGETIFEKPSFRASALNRRCVIMMTGFYEYHHQAGKKYPFFITPKSDDIMYVGGLWEHAKVDGEDWYTFTVVTVEANEVMSKIHNNPKNPHRMPLILRPDQVNDWLKPIEKDDKLGKEYLEKEILQPYPADDLNYITVPQLQGKAGVGDSEAAQMEYAYIDLELSV